MYVGSGCILFGCAGELTAHVLDGWYYGEISRFSTLNAMFNVGLTASFASLAAGMRRRQRMNAWLVVGAMLVSYWLGSKALQYFIQLLATLLLTAAHLEWSQGYLGLLFFASAISIIDCTYILVESNCQWLHVLPSLWSWGCYVVPILAPLEGYPFPKRSVVLWLAALMAFQVWLHRILRQAPSAFGDCAKTLPV